MPRAHVMPASQAAHQRHRGDDNRKSERYYYRKFMAHFARGSITRGGYRAGDGDAATSAVSIKLGEMSAAHS